jgi:hypothetical protein
LSGMQTLFSLMLMASLAQCGICVIDIDKKIDHGLLDSKKLHYYRKLSAPTMHLRGGLAVSKSQAEGADRDKIDLFDILILGGGVAAGYCVKELVAKGIGPGKVCMVNEENCYPYERPALTKGYLLGKLPSPKHGGFLCNAEDVYSKRGIDVRLCTKVTEIDFVNRKVTTQSTLSKQVSTVEYRQLVLATGVDVERLTVPGSSLSNIFYIRHVLSPNYGPRGPLSATRQFTRLLVVVVSCSGSPISLSNRLPLLRTQNGSAARAAIR